MGTNPTRSTRMHVWSLASLSGRVEDPALLRPRVAMVIAAAPIKPVAGKLPCPWVQPQKDKKKKKRNSKVISGPEGISQIREKNWHK